MGGIRWPIRLDPGQHFMLGDNTLAAADSRYRGPVDGGATLGVARCIFGPLSRWRIFE